MAADSKAAPAFPFSHARLDGSSVHETRPGPDAILADLPEAERFEVASVIYDTDGSTVITWADGLQVAATGYGRRARLAVTG